MKVWIRHLSLLMLELLWELAVDKVLRLKELGYIWLLDRLLYVSLIGSLEILLRRQFYALWKIHRFFIKERLIHIGLVDLLGLLRLVVLLWLLLFTLWLLLLLNRLRVLFIQIIYPILLLKLPSSNEIIDILLKIGNRNHKFSIEVNTSFAMFHNLLQDCQSCANFLNLFH